MSDQVIQAEPEGQNPVRVAFRDGLERYVRLGLVVADGLTVTEHDPRLWERIETLAAELRQRYAAVDLSSSPIVRLVRAMYHATGTDPTKRRPSSEALLRRVLREQELYRINTLVDLNNYLSLKSLLPIGLYDRDSVRGAIELRLGREGEPYQPIGRESLSVAGRMVLADELGPFGSPTSDSMRTMISPATRRAMAVFFAPVEYSVLELEACLGEFSKGVREYCGGVVSQTSTVP